MCKRLFSSIIAVCMLLSMFSVSAIALDADAGMLCPICDAVMYCTYYSAGTSSVDMDNDNVGITLSPDLATYAYKYSCHSCGYVKKGLRVCGLGFDKSTPGGELQVNEKPASDLDVPPSGYVGTGTPIISKDGGVNEVIESVKLVALTASSSTEYVDVDLPGNYGYVLPGSSTLNFKYPCLYAVLQHDVDGFYSWVNQVDPVCFAYNKTGSEYPSYIKSSGFCSSDPSLYNPVDFSKSSQLLVAGSILYFGYTFAFINSAYWHAFLYQIPVLTYKFTPFVPDGSIINNTNITINNNTYIGNIYTDNSTNITYIYPDDGSGTISDTPILYDNTTNEYITYDNTTNNYYYITYVTPEPTPTPDPDAPVATPGPDDPAATPDPDAVYNVNVLSVGEWFSDFVLELKGFFNTLGVGIAAGLADLDANFTLAVEQLSLNFNMAIENLNLNIKNYFIDSGLMPDPDASPTPVPSSSPSPSPVPSSSPSPVPSPSPTPVPSPDPDEDELVNSSFLEWLRHVIDGINAALGPVQEVGGTFVDFYGMLPMEVRATLTGALCILLAAGMWKFFGG